MTLPVLQIDRFLYPSANDTSAEQGGNPGFETDATGWAVNANGTIARTTAAYKSGLASGLFTKTSASSANVANAAYIYLRTVPPRGLIIPAASKITGPYDTLTVNATIPGAVTLEVANPERWPTAGTAILQDALNTAGSPRRKEVAWTGKSGSSLTGLLTNIRHESSAAATHRVGSALYGTTCLRRFLMQAWVFTDSASIQAGLAMHPTYVIPPSTVGYAGTGTVGIFTTLVQGEWTLLELVFDVTERNITDPAALKATGIEVRVQAHQLNAVSSIIYVDDVKLYHVLDLDQRVTQGPTLPFTDRGLIFERTAGGALRAGRVRPDVTRHVLDWSSPGSPISRQNKDRLEAWHSDLLYPANTMRTMDWQHVDPTGGDFRHPQREVMWAQSAPRFQEVGVGPGAGYLTEIPLEVIDQETTAL